MYCGLRRNAAHHPGGGIAQAEHRLSTLGQAAATVLERRQSDPKRLSQLFRGEVDWIVMKALEKDRNRRYETASAFAADIQRYLLDEPVSACPPSASYRVSKFVRRNRGAVLAASLVLLALVIGVIGTSFGLLRAQRATGSERQAKETAQQRLIQIEKANAILGSIFKDLNPGDAEKQNKPLQALLGERLDQATAQLEGEVIGDPLAVARMQMILGESQLGLGYAPKAILLFSKARTTFTAQLGADAPHTLTSMNDLALGYQAVGRFDLALPLFEETLERRKGKLGPNHLDTLQSRNNLALGYVAIHELGKAIPLFEETLNLIKVKLGPEHPTTLKLMNNLGMAYGETARFNLALPVLKEALRRRKAALGPNHADTLQSMKNLAVCYQVSRQVDQAMPLYEETLKRRKSTLGLDHPDTLQSMNNLAWGYQASGQVDEALRLTDVFFTGSGTVPVTPAAASSLSIGGFPSPTTAGTAANVTVTALDAYGNIATSYTGTVHFTSSDAKAVLPADFTFTAASAG